MPRQYDPDYDEDFHVESLNLGELDNPADRQESTSDAFSHALAEYLEAKSGRQRLVRNQATKEGRNPRSDAAQRMVELEDRP